MKPHHTIFCAFGQSVNYEIENYKPFI